MIVDIHTHVPAEAQWPLFLQHCRDHGVTIAVTSALGSWARYPDSADVRGANDQAHRFAGSSGGMVLWFAYLNPQNPDWEAELERSVADGACGVKLWVSLKDPGTGSLARVPPVLRSASARGLPVLVHTYQRTDENLAGEITVAECAELAREVPEVRLIAAHAGGNWRQCLGLVRDVPNLCVDVCGGYPETGMVEALVADLGADRVLYGSDALGRSFASQIAKVRFANLDDEAKETILWRNGAALLGLTEGRLRGAEAWAEELPPTPALPMPDFREDHFCFCGNWPFRGNPCPAPADLDEALARHGVARAFVADANAVFALDVLAANRAYATAAHGCGRIAPLAAMVPYAPNWRPVLDAACGRFAGGIAYPYLHNWRVTDPSFMPFFEAAAEAGFPLWINACTGDIRFRHRGTVCRDVTADEMAWFVRNAPANRYVVQGASPAVIRAGLDACPDAADVRFEISRLTDNSTALRETVGRFGWERLVLGTEFPFRDLRTVRHTARTLCRA